MCKKYKSILVVKGIKKGEGKEGQEAITCAIN